jgi:hypothetical protein
MKHLLSRKYVTLHIVAYLIAVVLLLWLKPFASPSSAYFWLPFVFGLVLAVHIFVLRTLSVDDAWVTERTERLRRHSYDFDHIANIEDRIEKNDPSVTPKSEHI